MLYVNLGGEEGSAKSWSVFSQDLWRPPPPLAGHVMRVTFPTNLVIVGGKGVKEDGSMGERTRQSWKMLDDDTVEKPSTDLAWSIFKQKNKTVVVEDLQAHGLTKMDRDTQHLATLPHWAAMAGAVEIIEYLREGNPNPNLNPNPNPNPDALSSTASSELNSTFKANLCPSRCEIDTVRLRSTSPVPPGLNPQLPSI